MPTLEKGYAGFLLGMFGFFSVGMLISQNDMFGPESPGGWPLVYWSKGTRHPIAEWWSRMTAILFLTWLSGPFAFNVPMRAHLKQTMVAMTAILANFLHINFVSAPDECVSLVWYPQIGLQVVLCAVNAHLLSTKSKRR